MDGYSLIDRMRKMRRRFRFTAIEQALYYELIAICNSESWSNSFSCSNAELCLALVITEPTLIKSRESLVNSGLIFYKSGKSRKSIGVYSFEESELNPKDLTKETTKIDLAIPLVVEPTTKETTKETTKDLTKETTKIDLDNINIKPKTETKTKTRKKEMIDLVFPFNSERFLRSWDMLVNMPKWKNKIPHSLQLALNSLGKYEEEFAIELIEKSIEGNWQGVTFQNTPDDYQKWLKRNGKNSEHSSIGEKQDFLKAVANGIGRAEHQRITSGKNSEDKKRSVERLADDAEYILRNLQQKH